MEKILPMLLLLGLAPFALRAQPNGNGPSVEVTGGLNQSRFSDEGAECLHALFFGADVVWCERNPLRFSTGLNFRNSGSEYKSGEDFGEGESYSFETRETLNYLNVPVEARYQFEAGKVKPFVRAGGTLGFLLSAKSKTTMNFNGRKTENETDIKNQKKSTNFALNLGGGVAFPLGRFRGVASVRYMIGLTNIVKNAEAPSAKTNDLSYAVGLALPF